MVHTEGRDENDLLDAGCLGGRDDGAKQGGSIRVERRGHQYQRRNTFQCCAKSSKSRRNRGEPPRPPDQPSKDLGLPDVQ